MKKGIGKTHIGKVRSKNQDAIFVQNDKIGALDNLFIVADGMGGHRAGEVASAASISTFVEYIRQAAGFDRQKPEEHLRRGAAVANLKIFKLQEENEEMAGMGTTFSAAGFYNGRLLYAHVGDSRIYKISKSDISTISNDHNFVAEMLRMGKITAQEAKNHPNKNIITRALGTDVNLEIDSGNLEISDDTVLLLCSDGLTDMVSDEQILEIMQRDISVEEKADKLVELAIENGGRDNISLILICND